MPFFRFCSFRRRRAPVAVDIGSSSVKLAKVTHAAQGPSIAETMLVPLPPGSVQNGWIRDRTTVAGAIEKFVRTHRLKGAAAVAAVPGRAVMIKTLDLSSMDIVDLETTVEFEAIRVIPENLDDVYLDYQILGETRGKQLTVLLAAVKKELVRAYMEILSKAGLDPRIIEVDYFALRNLCYHLHAQTHDQVVCIVHLGASAASVNIMGQGIPVFSSELETAGHILTRRLARDRGISFDQAEAIKLDDPLRSGTGNLAGSILSFCGDLAGGVERAITRFAAMHGRPEIDRLYVCGGGARLPGLQATLTEKLGNRVGGYEPLFGAAQSPCDPMKGLPLEFAVVGGLAMRQVWPE